MSSDNIGRMIVSCPNCGTKNRVDPGHAGVAKCGKCGRPLPAAADSPVDVTDATFAEEVLGSSIPVLVDCWAPWCGPCRMVGPVVDQLAKESAGRWKVAKLNTDDNQQTAGQLRIEGIPALLMFKNGQLVDRLVGAHPKPSIEAMLKKHL